MIESGEMRPEAHHLAKVLFEIPSFLQSVFASIISGITDVKLSLFSTYSITTNSRQCEMSAATFCNLFDYIKGNVLRQLAGIVIAKQIQSFWADWASRTFIYRRFVRLKWSFEKNRRARLSLEDKRLN